MTSDRRALLRELTEAFGIPGSEDEVRGIMARHLAPVAELSYDRMGSIIARQQGTAERPRIMLPGHMDEIGLIVRQITDEGFLRFVTVGGWWTQVMVSQRWTVRTQKGDLVAFSGARAPHLLTDEERGKLIQTKDMFLDIGAKNKEEALAMGVRPGDPVAPWGPYAEMGGERLLAKAWDDRLGCAMVIEVMQQLAQREHPNTVYGVGTIQEETGLYGARTTAYAVDPELALISEITCANDVPGVSQDGSYCELGKGPGICLRDGQMIPNRRLREFTQQVAEEAGIALQYVTMERGTTDGAVIQIHHEGVPTLYLGPPARYIHSHASIIDAADYDQCVRLLVEMIVRLDAKTVAGLTDFAG